MFSRRNAWKLIALSGLIMWFVFYIHNELTLETSFDVFLQTHLQAGMYNNHFNYTLISENITTCSPEKASDSITLLILIHSAPKSVTARDVLRLTVLDNLRGNRESIRYLFLLGSAAELELQNDILLEIKKYSDILLFSMIDSYENLTLKTVMGFKWASTNCTNAQYVLKTDDDVFLNIPNIVNLIHGREKLLENSLLGHCSAWTQQPERDKQSKSYVSKQTYPYHRYPPFCSGAGYITSMNVIKAISKVSSRLPYVHLEDVFVGICSRKLGINVISVKGFIASEYVLLPCFFKGNMRISTMQSVGHYGWQYIGIHEVSFIWGYGYYVLHGWLGAAAVFVWLWVQFNILSLNKLSNMINMSLAYSKICAYNTTSDQEFLDRIESDVHSARGIQRVTPIAKVLDSCVQ